MLLRVVESCCVLLCVVESCCVLLCVVESCCVRLYVALHVNNLSFICLSSSIDDFIKY